MSDVLFDVVHDPRVMDSENEMFSVLEVVWNFGNV